MCVHIIVYSVFVSNSNLTVCLIIKIAKHGLQLYILTMK